MVFILKSYFIFSKLLPLGKSFLLGALCFINIISKARSADNPLSPAKNAAENWLSAAKSAADNQLHIFPINQ